MTELIGDILHYRTILENIPRASKLDSILSEPSFFFFLVLRSQLRITNKLKSQLE